MPRHHLAQLLLCLASGPTLLASPFASALAEIDAQCPRDYPEKVTPLPETHELAQTPVTQLMSMLRSWNPSLREQAATALGRRGPDTLHSLRQATHDPTWPVRAGAIQALAAILAQSPVEPAVRHAIVDDFLRLTRDDQLEVRSAALAGLVALKPSTPAAAQAVLDLCADPDPYLADSAMIHLEKHFHFAAIAPDTLLAGLKPTFDSPLPRGKGHIIRLIQTLPAKHQREFIPELLAHLDWQPMRDTMFGAGGQAGAIEILTRLGETRLIPRLPELMGKTMRGPGLFVTALDAAQAFGTEAKPILPELKAILADLDAHGRDARITPRRDHATAIDQLRQTIQQLESL